MEAAEAEFRWEEEVAGCGVTREAKIVQYRSISQGSMRLGAGVDMLVVGVVVGGGRKR